MPARGLLRRHARARPSRPPRRPLIGRVPVLGVVLVGRAGAWARRPSMSGLPDGRSAGCSRRSWRSAGAVVWWYAPRVGYWMLLVDGLVTMAVSGIALARGAAAVAARRVLGRLARSSSLRSCTSPPAQGVRARSRSSRSSRCWSSRHSAWASTCGPRGRSTSEPSSSGCPGWSVQSPAPTLWTTRHRPGARWGVVLRVGDAGDADRGDARRPFARSPGTGGASSVISSRELSAEKAGERLDDHPDQRARPSLDAARGAAHAVAIGACRDRAPHRVGRALRS